MYSRVKSIAAAGVIIIIAVQPGADAARAPYSAQSERLNLELSGPMFNAYADPMAGAFQLGDLAQGSLPNSFTLAPPVAMIAPEPAPSILPEYPAIEHFDAEAPIAGHTTSEPGLVLPAAPPTVAIPPAASAPAPREALVSPQVPAPQKQRRETPRSQTALPAPRADLIAFDGPAGAPFAHTRFCLKYPAECRIQKLKFRGGPIDLTAVRRQELMRINAEVNRSIIGTPMNEPVAQEMWVISPKIGDCNDYAVTKRHKLIAAGWPARALLLAEVVTTWGEHHLVLVVRTRQGDFVADNLNANLRNWTKTPYEWVRVESPVNPLYWAKIKAPQPNVVAMNATGRRL